MRWMLFFDGRNAQRAWPVVRENICPNVKPRKSNSPSGTRQIRVLSSFTVSFSFPMIARRWCKDADPSAEFALCELHWRLIEQPAQQHRVEIAGEVHRNADPLGPGEVLNELVAGGVSVGRASQFRELLVQVHHCHS